MEACVNVLGRPEVFLISVALLTAILTVWAQQWVNTYKMYKDRALKLRPSHLDFIEYNASFWLGWIYLAILVALIAFASAALSYLFGWRCLLLVAIGLFAVSLYMTLVQVLQSWLSARYKFCERIPLDELSDFPSHSFLKKLKCLFLVLGLSIFGWIEAALWGIPWLFWTCVGIILVLLIIIGIFTCVARKKNDC